jgi:rfaE bifunctional protein nucleotidyltransferase chain/domain
MKCESFGEKQKLVDWPSLMDIRECARREGKIVVWTNGCFDLLHVGHIRSFAAARSLGDLLIVGINSDASVRQLKGETRPLVPVAERAEILSALSCINWIVILQETTPVTALSRLKPEIHCKGADYEPPNGKALPEAAIVKSYGGRIEFLPIVPGLSTTTLIEKLLRQ